MQMLGEREEYLVGPMRMYMLYQNLYVHEYQQHEVVVCSKFRSIKN